MRVTVRLFARLRDVAGWHERACDVPAGATVADVWTAAVACAPGLSPFGGAVSAAVNAAFARPAAPVRDGDDVAFLPPVSGGGWRS